ncbi:hypothetical protein NL676_031343 [Syzygium grande]|nr:hypothetical protein NL676_031343 [Syzygium grande]
MKRLKLIDPKGGGGGGDRPAKRPRLDEPTPPPAPAPPAPSSSSSSSAGALSPPRPPPPPPAAARAGEGMTNEVVEFIRLLEDELEKFNSFFVEKEEEYIIKLKPPRLSTKEKMSPASEADNAEESKEGAPSLLDLPELALECILEKLP